jgi:hypothetical protein
MYTHLEYEIKYQASNKFKKSIALRKKLIFVIKKLGKETNEPFDMLQKEKINLIKVCKIETFFKIKTLPSRISF